MNIINELVMTNVKILIAVIVAYCLDFLTGIAMAIKDKTFSSSKLRGGVSKAINYFVFVSLGLLADGCFDVNFATKTMCISVILIEITSIAENLQASGLKIPNSIMSIFNSNKN